MTRYSPSRSYLWAGVVSLAVAAQCGWYATEWPLAWAPAGLFLAAAAILFYAGSQPAVTVTVDQLWIGKRAIAWKEIARVDRTRWIAPLVVRLTLAAGERVMLLFPGAVDSSNRLLRHIRRSSRNAAIDGVPYHAFWDHPLPISPAREKLPSPRYRLLREEDEAEVELLFHRLKTVGRLDATLPEDN